MNSLVGKTIEMTVKHMSQAASGGSYVVHYTAEILITVDKQIDVSVDAVVPNNADARDIEAARKAINDGCVEVLSAKSLGARVSVRRLIVHPVDFKPARFAYWTAIDLEQCLDELSVSSE